MAQIKLGDTLYIFDWRVFRAWLDNHAYINFGFGRLNEWPAVHPTHKVSGTVAYDSLLIRVAGRKFSDSFYHSKTIHLYWWPLKLFISSTYEHNGEALSSTLILRRGCFVKVIHH